ncbi:MAG: hypothetical protein IJ220_08400 [Clostridia bacterium]|nr:hypothetical protein [Clostridia bacterium]
MNVRIFIKGVYNRLVIKTIKNTEDLPDISKWKEYLKRIGNDDDPIKESFRKHKCRMTYFGCFRLVLINILSFFYLCVTSFRVNKKRIEPSFDNVATLIERKAIPSKDIFPSALVNEYSNINIVDYDSISFDQLVQELFSIYVRIKKKYFFHPYYLLQIKQGLSMISYCLLNSTFNALIVYDSERDISTPIIKAYLESKGIKYISFMHGEYLLQLIQAHMSFSEYYIWHHTYIEMFKDVLKCNIGNYIIYKPFKMKKKFDFSTLEPDHFMTYYLSGESTVSLDNLVDIFNVFESNGKRCVIRFHPRYSHVDLIYRLFDTSKIENPKEIALETSLSSTEYVVGLSSTVLSEAYAEGKKIVIDDISNPKQFENIKHRYCIALSKEHLLLSDLISECK